MTTLTPTLTYPAKKYFDYAFAKFDLPQQFVFKVLATEFEKTYGKKDTYSAKDILYTILNAEIYKIFTTAKIEHDELTIQNISQELINSYPLSEIALSYIFLNELASDEDLTKDDLLISTSDDFPDLVNFIIASINTHLNDYIDRKNLRSAQKVALHALENVDKFVNYINDNIEHAHDLINNGDESSKTLAFAAKEPIDNEDVVITKEALSKLIELENSTANSAITYNAKITVLKKQSNSLYFVQRLGFLAQGEQYRSLSYNIDLEKDFEGIIDQSKVFTSSAAKSSAKEIRKRIFTASLGSAAEKTKVEIPDINTPAKSSRMLKIDGTLYKAYFRAERKAHFQFKEIFIEDNLIARPRADEDDFGFIELTADILADERDIPALKLYYEKIMGLIVYMFSKDSDLIFLNISIYFLTSKERGKFLFAPITVRFDRFSSFQSFMTQLEDMVSSKVAGQDYYSEANIATENLMLGMFAVHTSRKSYLGAGRHSSHIKKLYNIDEYSLKDNLCAVRMLNHALGMQMEEITRLKLTEFDNVMKFLSQRELTLKLAANAGGACLTDCSGECIDDESGTCSECFPKFKLNPDDNLIAIVADAFLVDNSLLEETIITENIDLVSKKIEKCSSCITFTCNCKKGACHRCTCSKCKRVSAGVVSKQSPRSFLTPQIKLKYIIGDENSKHKFVLVDAGSKLAPGSDNELVPTFHVDRILDYKYPNDKLYIDKDELKLLSTRESIGCKISSANERALKYGIGQGCAQSEYEDLIMFLDFEARTLADEFGIRQVLYSMSTLIVSPSELDELDADDKSGNVAKWHARTQFFLDESIVPDDFKKNPTNGILVCDIGLLLSSMFKSAALNRTRYKIVTFNGTNYDHLILNEILTNIDEESVDNVFWTGSKLNNMKIYNTHDCFDICRHLAGSLADVCSAFKVKSLGKSSFDHKKANIASAEGKLFEYLVENGLENIVNYNNLDVLCMPIILNRYNKELKRIIDSAPAILKKLSHEFKNDTEGLIGGIGDEQISFKRLNLEDVWHYPTIAGMIIKLLKQYWRNCGFVIENYNGKTIKSAALAKGKTRKVVPKSERLSDKEDFEMVYEQTRLAAIGGHVAQDYVIKDAVRVCIAMIYNGLRCSLDAASLYPAAALTFPSYFPIGNRFISRYDPSSDKIGFFRCKITQITETNQTIYIPLKVNPLTAHLYTDGKERLEKGNDWNYTGTIMDMSIDTDQINFLRSKGCVVEPLDIDGFYFTAKIKNLYLFGFLLAVAAVKGEQDDCVAVADSIKKGDTPTHEQQLSIDKINPVLRNTCKLLLNSGLGKLLQRVHVDKTKWVSFSEYTQLIADGRDPTMLTSFRENGLVLVKYKIKQEENMAASMPMHLGLKVYSVSKQLMHECIWDKLTDENGNRINPDYVDTDSCHTSYDAFTRWKKNIIENDIKIPHWPQLEAILPAYKTQRLFDDDSKQIGGFDDEMKPNENKGEVRNDCEIILGNKMYLAFNKQKYDEAIKKGPIPKKAKFMKLSSAGVNFANYLIIEDFIGLSNYVSNLVSQDKYKRFLPITSQKIIEMVNDEVIPLDDISQFVYKGDPRRTFLDVYKFGFTIMIRQIFQRNIKESEITPSSTVSLRVDTKILKRCDFIGSKQDIEMEQHINDFDIFSFMMTHKKTEFA